MIKLGITSAIETPVDTSSQAECSIEPTELGATMTNILFSSDDSNSRTSQLLCDIADNTNLPSQSTVHCSNDSSSTIDASWDPNMFE